MGDPGVTSTGTSTDLPVTVNLDSVSATAKVHPPAKTHKTETPPPQVVSTEADDYKKLIAKAQGLGVKLDVLDEQGNIKPDKLEEVKARVAQALDARLKEATDKGIKPDDPKAVFTVFLPQLLKN